MFHDKILSRSRIKMVNLATIGILPCLLLTATMILAGCATVQGQATLGKNAQSEELRKETTAGVPFPPGCPTHTMALPAGQTHLTVSYQEPNVDENKVPIKDLAYTTIYVSAPHSTAQAIRVWTDNSHGGALVTIHNVPAPAQDVALCVTATNWGRKESAPAPLIQPKP
jgi:predicted small secreted protein